MMRAFPRAILALPMLSAIPAFASVAGSGDELRAQIAELRAEQAHIAELQKQTEAKLHALEARLASSADSPVPAQSVAITPATAASESRLEVSGDVRVRSQGDYADTARDRTSAQVRARLGATYEVNDTVTVGGRLATGDPDDPNSSDVQLSNFDDDLQFTLDQAYLALDFDDLKLYGGKVPQPFARTDLVWDSDVNPQGVSATYKRALGDGAALRANGLFFIIDEQAVGPESTMLGGQVEFDSRAYGDWSFDASAAYYGYTLGSIAGADEGDFRSNLRNPDGSYLSDFDLGNLLVGATWSGAGERWPVRVVGDFVHNFGAATSANTGFGVDLTVGRTRQSGDWRVTYGYSIAETDAVLAAFSHDNLALATNYRLHALTFDYLLLPKTMLSAIWYHYEPYEEMPGIQGWLDRWRLSLLVSF